MDYEIVLTAKEAENRESWLKAREKGIGGSDAAAIVGLSKWKSAFALWSEKTGRIEPEDISDKEVVYWGTQLEEMVAREFCKRTGKKVKKQGLYRNKKHPFMLASVDRMIIGEQAGLECKTTSAYKVKDWEGDNLPDSYYIQCQHYMMVTGLPKWYIAVLIGGNQFVWKEIPRNEEDIEALRQAEINFWIMVENNTMPTVDGSDNAAEALKARFKGGITDILELDGDCEKKLTRLDQLTTMIKELDTEAKTLKNELCSSLGDYEQGRAGKYIVKWSTVAGRKSIDSKALQKAEPAIYEKYLKAGKPTRRFAYEIKEDE